MSSGFLLGRPSYSSVQHRRSGVIELLASLVVVTVLFGWVLDSGAQQTSDNLIYNFDANADQVLDDGWESSINSGERDWQFSSDTRVAHGFHSLQTNATLGDLHGISGRLNFPRTNNDFNSGRDSASSDSYNSAPKFAEGDATWEFWIRIDNNTDSQIIWESGGGGDGSAFAVSGGNLQWVIKDTNETDSVEAAITTGEFHHVVGVYDRDDPTATDTTEDTMTLYIDGVQVATTRDNGAPTAMHDWDGGDPASLGGETSTNGGTGGALGDISAYSNLDGQIAAYRFHNAALTQAQVDANVEAVQAATVYFDDGFGTIGVDTLWRNETNWDTNLVSSQEQDVVINAGQSVEIDSATAARVQTLFIGDDGVSSLSGYATDGTTPADGNGILEMSGGTLVATQIILGNGDNQGTFNFTDGTITVSKDGNAAFSGQQAFHVGFSGTGASNTNVFTMGTAGGATSPVLNVSGGRFEIGENGNAAGGTRINATFNMRSGTLNVNGQNLILGQSGIGDASDVIFNLEGGTVNIGSDFNINDGTAQFTQTGGFISMRDLQTQNNTASADTLQLNGGVFEIRDDLNDRAGTSQLNIAGGRLELDAVNPGTREVENINFSSGIIEFSFVDEATGFKALTVGTDVDADGTGVFTGSGQIEIELDNTATGTAIATSTTWTGASGSWTTTNTAEWDSDNPIQYLLSGVSFDLIVPNTALTTMTDLDDLSAVGSDWTLSRRTEFNADDTLVITSANDIGLTPIKAVINSAGNTITRNTDLLISAEAGGDAAGLDMIDGTLDLSTSGSSIQIGGEAVAELLQTGGVINANNLTFGGSGGTLSLEGGTLNLDGVIVEGALGAPDAGVSNAQLHIDGGTLNVAGDSITVQRFAAGNDTGTTGFYTATKKSVVSTGTTSIGSAGTGTYLMEESTHTAANFTVGESGTGIGVVTQRGGRVETVSFLYAGQNGDGTYTMERNRDVVIPELVVGNTLIVGTNGSGRFDVLDGRVDINAGGFDVAEGTGSTGIVNVGSSVGVYNPFITVSGGNFETALGGTGTVNLLSGRILQETNNLITGQGATSIANVTMGGGQGKFVYDFVGNSEWNTNDGQGNVDVLKNATVNIGRNLNLGTGGALDLHLNGGAINVGVNNGGADLNYRTGSGTTDSIRITDGLLTVADDFIFDQGTGRFQVDGSGNKITVGDAYSQGATSTLVARIDPLGLSPIEVTGDATFASGSILDVDETIIGDVAPNSATTFGTAGAAWDGTGTDWDKGNPSAAGISNTERVVVLTYGGTLTDNGLALDAGDTNWTLDTSVSGEIAVIAQTDFGTAPVHAILDSDGVTTRASDLTIDASGAAADAAGLTVTSGDTLTLDANFDLTVQGGATLAGEGTINTSGTGSTTIASGATLSSGATDTGLVGGGSTAGTMTFSGDLTLASGSTWLVDIVDASTVDRVDVAGTFDITNANLVFGGFTPDPHTTYTIASYGSLSGTFSGLAEGTRINGYEISYGVVSPGEITLTAVPEPTTIIPMILGALAGGVFLRQRRKQAAASQAARGK